MFLPCHVGDLMLAGSDSDMDTLGDHLYEALQDKYFESTRGIQRTFFCQGMGEGDLDE